MHTVADLPIGAKLKFGAYSVNGEKPHRVCWQKVHNDCTLLSEYIEAKLAFDGRELTNPIQSRAEYGNNRYSHSNLHQFLNATADTDWYAATHAYDARPVDARMRSRKNGYANKPGFLHLFEHWELDCIKVSEVKTMLPPADRQDDRRIEYETTQARVFIPSKSNLGIGTAHGEGDVWDFFASMDDESLVARFSVALFCNSSGYMPDHIDDPWYYWLRTPRMDNHSLHFVSEHAIVANCRAYAEYIGVRPALKVSPNAFVTTDPDDGGYYDIISSPDTEVPASLDEILDLCKRSGAKLL